jgi:hypothetical protein
VGHSLPLAISLRDANNQLIDFSLSGDYLSWFMHTTNSGGGNIVYESFENKRQNFSISTQNQDCGIL